MTHGNPLCFTHFGQEFATSVFLHFPVHNISSSGTFSGTLELHNSTVEKILVIKKTLDFIVLLYIYLVKKKKAQKEFREGVGEIYSSSR